MSTFKYLPSSNAGEGGASDLPGRQVGLSGNLWTGCVICQAGKWAYPAAYGLLLVFDFNVECAIVVSGDGNTHERF